MRAKCKSHHFGRSELMPIEYPNNIGSYLGKYLNKDDEGREKGNWANVEMTQGMRRVSYGRKETKTHSANFSWVKHPTGKPLFRHMLKEWAEYRGYKDTDHIRAHLGKHWSHHYYPEIMFDVPRMEREARKLPPLHVNGEIPLKPNTLESMGSRTLEDPFEVSENELWTKWLADRQKSRSLEFQRWEKWKKAEEAKKRLSYLYD